MPQVALSLEGLRALLPVPVRDDQFEELLFSSKAEVVGRGGDLLTISVTPDRLDLLSEAGLALELQGILGTDHGFVRRAEDTRSAFRPAFRVDASADPIRPWIAGVVVRAPEGAALDEGTLSDAIRFQEVIHATLGRDRRTASLGIYPGRAVQFPVHYGLEPVSHVRFVPLEATEETDGERFFSEHPLAGRFGPYGRVGDRCLVLRDAAGTVLSLPPILNSRTAGEARPGDRELLLESTGTQRRSVLESLGLLSVVFAVRGWKLLPVEVDGPADLHDDGRAVVSPRAIDLSAGLLHEVIGEALSSAEVERRLARARLSGTPHEGGWRVTVPPWRPDLQTATDLTEEVFLAAPVLPEHGLVSPSPVRGRHRAETLFRRRVATDLVGLGFVAPHTSLLVSATHVGWLPGSGAIRLRNPASTEFAFLRDRLLLSHLDVLAHNTRHAYPQRFAEVGPVLVRSEGAESGAETRFHAGLVVASDTAGFAEAAARVDYLLRRVDVSAVREACELPGTIPGRAARARVAGEAVAELGEIHPALLTELGVPVPAVWAEVDLTALHRLVRSHEDH